MKVIATLGLALSFSMVTMSAQADWMGKAWSDTKNAVSKGADDTINASGKAVSATVNVVVTAGTGAVAAVGSVASGAGKAVVSAVAAAGGVAGDGVKALLDGGNHVINQVGRTLDQAFKQVVDTGKSMLDHNKTIIAKASRVSSCVYSACTSEVYYKYKLDQARHQGDLEAKAFYEQERDRRQGLFDFGQKKRLKEALKRAQSLLENYSATLKIETDRNKTSTDLLGVLEGELKLKKAYAELKMDIDKPDPLIVEAVQRFTTQLVGQKLQGSQLTPEQVTGLQTQLEVLNNELVNISQTLKTEASAALAEALRQLDDTTSQTLVAHYANERNQTANEMANLNALTIARQTEIARLKSELGE